MAGALTADLKARHVRRTGKKLGRRKQSNSGQGILGLKCPYVGLCDVCVYFQIPSYHASGRTSGFEFDLSVRRDWY